MERIEHDRIVPSMSIISRIELEGGTYRDPAMAGIRRTRLDEMLAEFAIFDLDTPIAVEYSNIVRHSGFSRPRILDRLIAATAIVHNLTLITINGDDFRDIPGLKLEIWPSPVRAQ